MTMTGAPRRKGVSPAALVVFIVIAVVSLVLAYFIYTAKEDWRKRFDTLTQEKQVVEQDKLAVDAVVDEWKGAAGISLEGLRGELTGDVDTVKKLVDTERAKARAQTSLTNTTAAKLAQVQKQLNSTEAKLSNAQDAAKQALETLTKQFTDYRTQAEADKAGLRKRIDTINTERQQALDEVRATKALMTDLDATHRTEKIAWQAERQKLLLRMREGLPPVGEAAAGKISSVDAYGNTATINRGRKDRVQPGMIFEVYGASGAGERVSKGRVEVRRVGERASVVGLLEVDPRNPIVAGDLLRSPFIATEHPKFVVAGWFKPGLDYRQQEVKTFVRKWGGEVVDEVDVDTDYLVIGEYRLPGTVTDAVAVAAAKNGLKQLNTAKAFGVIILDVEDFLKLVTRG